MRWFPIVLLSFLFTGSAFGCGGVAISPHEWSIGAESLSTGMVTAVIAMFQGIGSIRTTIRRRLDPTEIFWENVRLALRMEWAQRKKWLVRAAVIALCVSVIRIGAHYLQVETESLLLAMGYPPC